MSQVIGLFATPLMRVERAIDPALTAALCARALALERSVVNTRDAKLSHSPLFAPGADPQFAALAAALTPRLVEFGMLLFGERLDWSIKELWLNVLEPGASQALHNHANSFVSGVLYLTRPHASTLTVFCKPPGSGFAFANTHAGSTLGPFNADKWVAPPAEPGDLLLFPSHLLHEVPVNAGERRLSLAFNAIPDRLESWGYTLRFSA